MRAPEARPVTLTFQAEYELAGLPAVAELSADQATRPIDAPVIEEHTAEGSNVPTIVGTSPAAVRADVETAPVYLNDFAPKTLCLKCNIRSFLPSA